MMNRAQFYKQLNLGLNAVFGRQYKRFDEIWRKLFDVETSSKAFEEEVMNIGLGLAAEKGEGAPVSYDQGSDSFVARYVHKTYALAFAITEEAEEDGLYGSLGARYARALARSMQETKEIVGHSVYNNGFSSSYPMGDGVALLSASHPLFGGGTLSNKLATPADLSEAAMEDLTIQIGLWTDDRGLQLNLKPKSLVIPTALQFVAQRLLDSPFRSGTGDNDINALKQAGVIKERTISPYLTDPDAWFVRVDVDDGLKHFVRKKIARGMEGDFETGNLRYKSRERYSFGASDWRAIAGSEGG